MAASKHAIGTDFAGPGAEALSCNELHRRDCHATIHLSGTHSLHEGCFGSSSSTFAASISRQRRACQAAFAQTLGGCFPSFAGVREKSPEFAPERQIAQGYSRVFAHVRWYSCELGSIAPPFMVWHISGGGAAPRPHQQGGLEGPSAPPNLPRNAYHVYARGSKHIACCVSAAGGDHLRILAWHGQRLASTLIEASQALHQIAVEYATARVLLGIRTVRSYRQCTHRRYDTVGRSGGSM